MTLPEFAAEFCPELSGIDWSPRISATLNFWMPTITPEDETQQSELADLHRNWILRGHMQAHQQNVRQHLPLVGMMVIFPETPEVMFLSEREAEIVLSSAHFVTRNKDVVLCTMSKFMATPSMQHLPKEITAQILLFSGRTQFHGYYNELLALIRSRSAASAAKMLVECRGNTHAWHLSHLHQACQLAFESAGGWV
jgi:hypothetical protein